MLPVNKLHIVLLNMYFGKKNRKYRRDFWKSYFNR